MGESTRRAFLKKSLVMTAATGAFARMASRAVPRRRQTQGETCSSAWSGSTPQPPQSWSESN